MAKANPIRLGLAGLGRAGWGMHCPELQGKEDKFQIVAACDIAKDRRDRMANRYPCRVYDKIEDMIADPEVELVDIATRSTDHYAHASAALRAGKHVFLEKPMTVSYAEARRLQMLANRSKGGLYIRHNRRFDPDFLHVQDIIRSGVIGEVYQISLARMHYARRDDWQALIDCGGGQLLNWGPHIIDHAMRLLESPPANVWGSLKRIAAVGDAEDHLKVVLTGTNGRVVDIEISGGSALPQPEYILLGTRGALTVSGGTISLKYLDPKQKLPPRKANPGNPDDHFGSPETLKWIEETMPVGPSKTYDIWDELYRAIRQHAGFPITLDEAVANMKVISAVKRGTEFEMKPGRSKAKEKRRGPDRT